MDFRSSIIHLRSTILGLVLTLTAATCPAVEVSEQSVADAIGKIRAYLYARQQPHGAWDPPTPVAGDQQFGGQYGGTTALVTLALLLAGDSAQRPELARAITWLEQLRDEDFQGCYARALRASVWAQLPDHYLPRLHDDARWLLQSARLHERGLFDYLQQRSARVDHSVTQYGVLGLWEAAKRDVEVPATFWKTIGDHFLAAQNPDGGWAYGSDEGHATRGTMAAAGLASLFIVQQQLHRADNLPEPNLTAAIERGLAWFDQNFTAHASPGGGPLMYYLYGVERVGIASGYKTFNHKDWYRHGAKVILDLVGDSGHAGGLAESAFALMFLARGRYPVWVSKLQVPGARWGNRPMDLEFFTRYLCDYREATMDWQIVHVDTDPRQWLNAPLLYLASDDVVALTPQRKKNILTYLRLGGTLLCSPDNGSEAFLRSAADLAAQLFPQYALARLRIDDPLFRVQDPIERADSQPVLALSNGARHLIYLATRDWGYVFQSDDQPGQTMPWRIMVNIWAMTSDRGLLPGRLAERVEPRRQRQRVASLRVARLRYAGNWDPEPGAWMVLSDHVWNRAGLELNPETVDLDQLGDAAAPLAHLAGVEPYELTDPQLHAIQQYVARGGTVLVETVGGRDGFTATVEHQCMKLLGNAAATLTDRDPILTGQGLPAGYDNRRVNYRRYAVIAMSPGYRPRLAAIYDGPRPAVIVSGEDLSLGVLGAPHWNTLGYERGSALRLMTNILLWAAQQPFRDGNPGQGYPADADPR